MQERERRAGGLCWSHGGGSPTGQPRVCPSRSSLASRGPQAEGAALSPGSCRVQRMNSCPGAEPGRTSHIPAFLSPQTSGLLEGAGAGPHSALSQMLCNRGRGGAWGGVQIGETSSTGIEALIGRLTQNPQPGPVTFGSTHTNRHVRVCVCVRAHVQNHRVQ